MYARYVLYSFSMAVSVYSVLLVGGPIVDLGELLGALRRGWWLVVAGLAVALGAAALLTMFMVPQYATSVTFFVTTPSQGVIDSYQGGLFSQQRVTSYEYLLSKGALARSIADEPGIGLTPEQVQSRITSRALRDTVLLEVAVIDSDQARSYRIAEVLTRKFVSRIEALETHAGVSTSTVKVEAIVGPRLDPVPVSPKPGRNLAFGALSGLLIGVVVAVVRGAMDRTVKTAELLDQITGTPVLAVVPYDSSMRRSPLVLGSRVAQAATRRRWPQLARAEAVRHLRTNLQFVNVDHQIKVVVITSSVVGEGKSTTAANVAVAFAEAGFRVALVEADLRRPRAATYLGLDGAVGLSQVLAGELRVQDVMLRWGRLELHVLPSGLTPANPSELLGSARMVALLAELREAFDLVIVDTPPVLPFTDAAVVTAMADGAVLVVRSGHTHQARIRTAVARLRAVDSAVVGTVLNMNMTREPRALYGDSYRHRAERREPGQRSATGAAASSNTSEPVPGAAPAPAVGSG